ncbi:methyltransferase domain-containing protein [Zavarzinella formosa]|uniref:methyltransferase domain-containing protein n=1 Tax=Zavarzinella formosa TaxID=360055 RepID=UPI0002FD1939|nr:methyltransferase domain-containing protein [Zavarzinella formosa]
MVRPLEDLSKDQSAYWDAVVFDNSLCFSPNQPESLRQACRILKPGGRLMIGDVVRKRTLPRDLENQLPLRSCGFVQAILSKDYPRLLTEAGFSGIKLMEQPGIDELIVRYDLALWEEPVPCKPVTEEEWIASTQACCGLDTPRSEKLAEILKCEDVNSLWATAFILADKA